MDETIRYYAPGSGLTRPRDLMDGRTRSLLHNLQRGRCFLCGEPFKGGSVGRLQATSEHVIPRTRGGLNHRNRLLAHKHCNERKGERKPYPCERLYCEAIYDIIESGSNFHARRRR